MIKRSLIVLFVVLAITAFALMAFAQDTPALSDKKVELRASDREIYVPTTISLEAQLVLKALVKTRAYTRTVPEPTDLEAWRKVHAAVEESVIDGNNIAVERTGVTVTDTKLGGVQVLDIRPKDWKNDGKVLVYTHGGAYTLFSAHSTLVSSASMCQATELRVISVNYTTSPFADWSEIQEQVISVVKALLAEGYSMKDIAFYGDSAGGGLAISTVLNLRDLGIGMPAAVVLWSPWADITNAGDTPNTLEATDPTLSYNNSLYNCALAYANGLELTDPRVSPLYADFSKGFSPALIQAGTKEILLSTSVRLFQKLEAADQITKLDIYEGMWHVFQQFQFPETKVALKKSAAFINEHLE